MPTTALSLTALRDFPLIAPGDDLADALRRSIDATAIAPRDGDVFVIAQKVVSKAEGRYIQLADISPSKEAIDIAEAIGKDARYVEVVLSESDQIVKTGERLLIVAHKLGFVMANAGIDESNIPHESALDRVLLLPKNPDSSAETLKAELERRYDVRLAIIISDSFGRPWRRGVVGVALGAAGIAALVDMVGEPDLFGRPMRVTEIALADALASAAAILMGEGDEGQPAVLIRGLNCDRPNKPAAALIRERERDLFR